MAKSDPGMVDLLGVLDQDPTNQIGSFKELYLSNINKDMNNIVLLLCHSHIELRLRLILRLRLKSG